MLLMLACTRPPAPAQTAAASLAARPEWVPSTAYAPNAPDEVLDHATAWEGPLEGALLACQVETTRKLDARSSPLLEGRPKAEPDLLMHLWQGSVRVDAQGPDDTPTGRIGAPSVHLQEGEDVRLTLRDRGLIRAVEVDELTGTYDGALPMALDGEHSTGLCAKVPDDVVADALLLQNQRTDELLDALGKVPADPEDPTTLEPAREQVRSSVHVSAGLVGWDHPDVLERTRRLEAEESAFGRRLAEANRARAVGPQGDLQGTPLAATPPDCSWAGCTVRVVGQGTPPMQATWMDASGKSGPFLTRERGDGFTLIASIDGEGPYTVRAEDRLGSVIVLEVPEG